MLHLKTVDDYMKQLIEHIDDNARLHFDELFIGKAVTANRLRAALHRTSSAVAERPRDPSCH